MSGTIPLKRLWDGILTNISTKHIHRTNTYMYLLTIAVADNYDGLLQQSAILDSLLGPSCISCSYTSGTRVNRVRKIKWWRYLY